ncbi:ribosome maturation factor RimP [Tersicoccus solisilvae]|uniref:Ribosome maturation factor RimP n=1 Tax=Tersicoccus solisilvae TaxID=1882339 RepID=A0ABQ1PLA9_9MICC|nr:ribosome maturation factor RimP [Tersicoccus solisilvae]GGC99157.1 ribosome maturation factor RimP [Tersicoccus solisilvae]
MAARSGQKHAPVPRRNAQPAAADVERVEALLAPLVADAGLHLEQIRVHGPATLRTLSVVVDLPEDRSGSLSLDEVAEVSRRLSDALDEQPDTLPGPVNLEVSSPGAERKLTEPRHWRRSVGRLVSVVTTSGSTVVGRLTAADETEATLVPRLEGAKGTKPKDGDPVRMAYATVTSARVQVEFTAPEDEDRDQHDDTDQHDSAEDEEA